MVTLMTIILWRIWKCRNARVFNEDSIDPQQAVYMAVREATEFIEGLLQKTGGKICWD